jgi:hypothetical protein
MLKIDIKGSIDPASISKAEMTRNDILQENGSILSETTKEGLEAHQLQSNIIVSRDGGIPFLIH